MDNEFFRVNNSVVCVDYTNEIHKKLHKMLCKGAGGKMNVKIIHIAVYNLDDIDANCLMNLADKCKNFKVKCILHCFDDVQKDELKRVLNDKIGTYFRVQKEHTNVILTYVADGKSITFGSNDGYLYVRIKMPKKNGTLIRKMIYTTISSRPATAKRAIRRKYITETNIFETR